MKEGLYYNQLKFIPIINFFNDEKDAELAGSINHGYNDLNPEVPSFREFFIRSIGRSEQYQRYMTYLLVSESNNQRPVIIGVLAVQRVTYDEITQKLLGVEPPFKGECIYLSWIVVHKKYQHLRFFKLLFTFYETLLKRLAKMIGGPVFGALIGIRRLRVPLYMISGAKEPYTETVEKIFCFRGSQIEFWGVPIELLQTQSQIKKDHYYVRIVTQTDIQQ